MSELSEQDALLVAIADRLGERSSAELEVELLRRAIARGIESEKRLRESLGGLCRKQAERWEELRRQLDRISAQVQTGKEGA